MAKCHPTFETDPRLSVPQMRVDELGPEHGSVIGVSGVPLAVASPAAARAPVRTTRVTEQPSRKETLRHPPACLSCLGITCRLRLDHVPDLLCELPRTETRQ